MISRSIPSTGEPIPRPRRFAGVEGLPRAEADDWRQRIRLRKLLLAL